MAVDQRDSLDLNLNELLNFRVQSLSADPTNLEARVYYNTTSHTLRFYNGTAWADLSASSYAAENAQDDIAAAFAAGSNTVVTVSYNDAGNSFTLGIGTAQVTLPMIATQAANTVVANTTGSTASPTAVTLAAFKTWLALVAADISNFDTQVRTSTLNQMTAPTADLSINSHKLTNVVDGVATTDAATVGQLNAAIEGRQWKDPVTTATGGALPNTPTYNSGAGTLTSSTNTTLAAQSGHTLLINERILVKDQASTFQNGIYQISALGSGAAPWVLTRVLDASTAAELSNATTIVEGSDSTLKGKIYTQQNTLADLTAAAQSYTITGDNNTYTADSTTITLSGNQFAVTSAGISGTQLAASVAGNGLTGGAGSALAVNTDGTTIEVSGDAVRIAATAAGAGLGGGGGSALIVNAGTGITTTGDAVNIDTTLVPRMYKAALVGGATSEVITHSLGTRDVHVQFWNQNTPWEQIIFTVEATSTNTVTVRSGANITAGIRIVVMG